MKLFVVNIILGLTFFCCKVSWMQEETPESEIKYKRVSQISNIFKNKKEDVSFVYYDSCFVKYSKDDIKKKTINNQLCYEYNDTIRLYVNSEDSSLIKLLDEGLISGSMFFEEYSKCYTNTTENPVKSIYNNWEGYNLSISNFFEKKILKIPNRVKNKWSLIKIYEFTYGYINEPYIGQTYYEIQISNKKYKISENNIPFHEFLNGAYISHFFKTGVEG